MFIGKVTEQSSASSPNEQRQEEDITISQITEELYEALKEIESLVKLLECRNPTTEPTGELDKIGGCWKLITAQSLYWVLNETKLGLRDFVSLGDLLQQIDIAQDKTVHVLKFDVRGLNLLDGEFRIVTLNLCCVFFKLISIRRNCLFIKKFFKLFFFFGSIQSILLFAD